jgi:hypothetical protein
MPNNHDVFNRPNRRLFVSCTCSSCAMQRKMDRVNASLRIANNSNVAGQSSLSNLGVIKKEPDVIQETTRGKIERQRQKHDEETNRYWGKHQAERPSEPPPSVYKNTRSFPDLQVRETLQDHNHDVMLLTLPETFAYLQSQGWKETQEVWREATDSKLGQVMINFGANGKDVVTTSMILAKLDSLDIRATAETNHLGNELIKFMGWPNIGKIINAPRFRLNNPKVVDVGIGQYGLNNSIVNGARVTFYVAAAYRTIDFILNDKKTLANYIGGLAADVVNIGIVSALTWEIGTVVVTPFVVANIAVVVTTGLLLSVGINYIDKKYGLSDKVVEYLERAQQEVVEKAKEIEDGFWDMGAMLVDGLLDTGRQVVESEIKAYARKTLQEIKPRLF